MSSQSNLQNRHRINKKYYKSAEEYDKKKVLQNTSDYLKNYLTPNKNWNKRISPKERINQIRYSNVNWKTVSTHIRKMQYQDFLQTPYWKAISAHSKFKARHRCQICNSAYNLATHHRNYAIHGFEHAHIHELVVLCDDCHSKFHNKIPKSKYKRKAEFIVFIINLMVLSGFIAHFLIKEYLS
ncbi:MAG: hypothetical protein ACRCSV_01445 [Chlamydiales bacterium]